MQGIFITLEGIEGSGKSTQAKLLADWLQKRGQDVILLREPGSTRIGEKIREVLLNKNFKEMTPLTELFLFLASRAQLVDEKIRPALEKGVFVILDRYTDSTLVYQGFAHGLDITTIQQLNTIATGGLEPDITFLLDMDIHEGLNKSGFKDRIEEKGLDFHLRVREGYFKLAEQYPQRIFVVKVKPDPQDTHSEIVEIFCNKFSI